MFEKVSKVLKESLCNEDLGIKPESTWEDLGADSLDQVEIILALEDEFGIEMSDEEAERCKTVQDIAEIVGSLV